MLPRHPLPLPLPLSLLPLPRLPLLPLPLRLLLLVVVVLEAPVGQLAVVVVPMRRGVRPSTTRAVCCGGTASGARWRRRP